MEGTIFNSISEQFFESGVKMGIIICTTTSDGLDSQVIRGNSCKSQAFDDNEEKFVSCIGEIISSNFEIGITSTFKCSV